MGAFDLIIGLGCGWSILEYRLQIIKMYRTLNILISSS
jgi:hypothetical protein